jgi:ribonuclease D
MFPARADGGAIEAWIKQHTMQKSEQPWIWVAFDLEFTPQTRQLVLVSLCSSDGEHVLIARFHRAAVSTCRPMLDLFANRAIVKFGCCIHQDLLVLKSSKVKYQNVVDLAMVANLQWHWSPLIGLTKLAWYVADIRRRPTELDVDKARASWSEETLPAAQLYVAVEDCVLTARIAQHFWDKRLCSMPGYDLYCVFKS